MRPVPNFRRFARACVCLLLLTGAAAGGEPPAEGESPAGAVEPAAPCGCSGVQTALSPTPDPMFSGGDVEAPLRPIPDPIGHGPDGEDQCKDKDGNDIDPPCEAADGTMHCYRCFKLVDGVWEGSCEHLCKTGGSEVPNDCYLYDTTGDGVKNSCTSPCAPVGDETEGHAFRCDTTDNGIPNDCEYQCGQDENGQPNACATCDNNQNGHPEFCKIQCPAVDGETEPRYACPSCDTDGDEILDACGTEITNHPRLIGCLYRRQTGGYVPQPNNCSVSKDAETIFLTNLFGGTGDNPTGDADSSFLPCCEKHDIEYRKCAPPYSNLIHRLEADRRFGKCMAGVCDDTYPKFSFEWLKCRQLASAYKLAVNVGGTIPYTNAQIEACSCCSP